MIPYVSTAKAFIELNTGMDLITGKRSDRSDFSLASQAVFGAIILPSARAAGATGLTGVGASSAAPALSTVNRIRQVAQQGYNYAVRNPRVQGLSRSDLGTDADVQATRWLRRWAERNDVNLGPSGLEFKVRGAHSAPDIVFNPALQIFDFKLTPAAVRSKQTRNFRNDFPGYSVEYIFGP